MHRFANPGRFLRIARVVMPWSGAATILLLAIGLPWALVYAPPDYQQGETVRIMYVHVPAAWMALFCYLVMAMAGAAGLVWKHPLADLACKAAAPIGACFTLVCLITGSLWGKPMWGTWWVWDARLTSVLVLFLLYLGYLALVDAFDDPRRGLKAGALLAVFGAVNLPIIKFSVDWWNTLHQPASVARLDGPAIHPDILWPLLVMALAFKALFVTLFLARLRAELAAAKLRNLRARQASGDGPAPVPVLRPAGERP